MSIDLIEKTCTKCGETFPLSGFYRNRSTPDGRARWCKACSYAASKASSDRLRAEVGEEAWRAHRTAIVVKSRQRNGNASGKENQKAQRAAFRVLRDRHRKEWEHLLLLARRGELPEGGAA